MFLIFKKNLRNIWGYCADESFLLKIADIVTDLTANYRKPYYICDPVLGDDDSYYVPESLTKIYRDSIIPLADVITPNQFELKVLSGLNVDTEGEVLAALSYLHSTGIKHVVVTSSELGGPDQMFGYGSSPDGGVFRFEIARFPYRFFGTGDVFTTLLLIWMSKTNFSLKQSVNKVLSSIQDILQRTIAYYKQHCDDQILPEAAQLELRLIQSMDDILCPKTPVNIVDIHKQ